MTDLMMRGSVRHEIPGHKDAPTGVSKESSDAADELCESKSPLEDSGCTRSDSSSEEDEMENSVLEDMQRFEESFKGINKRYRLINRIGEGTFSTVYKAEDLHYEYYKNDWDTEGKENIHTSSTGSKIRSNRRKPHYVAIKKIYVTSSPGRIMNELELLHDLRHDKSVCPLITAFRHQDQVIAILPYFRHLDFRAYFREMRVADMRHYFRSLLTALAAVHAKGIIHRDIKPTNFLYDTVKKRGVLVDFGLAEREGTDYNACICELEHKDRQRTLDHSWAANNEPMNGYPKEDRRPSLRANRAGTRGFRAPEVLFKCSAQTTKVDVWSVGVILLTMLSKRFPFFHSADDIDAIIELTTVFGRIRMRQCALTHGQVLETNLPTITEKGHGFEKIILWSLNRPVKDANGESIPLRPGEATALDFLNKCMALDVKDRITAPDALRHGFLVDEEEGSEDEVDTLALG